MREDLLSGPQRPLGIGAFPPFPLNNCPCLNSHGPLGKPKQKGGGPVFMSACIPENGCIECPQRGVPWTGEIPPSMAERTRGTFVIAGDR